MKIGELEKAVDEMFDALLVPPTTFSELANLIEYKFNSLMVE